MYCIGIGVWCLGGLGCVWVCGWEWLVLSRADDSFREFCCRECKILLYTN